MALRQCTRPVDGTIPVQALLYNDEELYASQDGAGIYDGLQKSANHQVGTVHVSSHRLFYLDAQHAFSYSFSMDLSQVTQTEYYAGLFKSSPKVTLHLSGNSPASGQVTSEESQMGFESWECEVCAYRNPPGLSPAASRICGLCGIPRPALPALTSPLQHLSTSLPSTSIPSSVSPSAYSSAPSVPRSRRSSTVACPACTFLNHPSLRTCEICSNVLPQANYPQTRGAMNSAPTSRPGSPDLDDDDFRAPQMIKISFRKGGDKTFYAVLKRTLKGKAWESDGFMNNHRVDQITRDSSSAGVDINAIGRSGISGILRTVENNAQGRETHLKDAVQDLEALMVKAKDMVRLAAELNEKLTAAAASSQLTPLTSTTTLEPEEATFIRSSLTQLGLQMSNVPVTLDMMKDEKRWYEELARELARVLQGSSSKGGIGMMTTRGIIALDEVWGGWNRARGVALLPPSTFLVVIPHLPACTEPPIRLRTFTSGLQVLHTPPYTHAAFTARLSGWLALAGPRTTMEIALEEMITVSLSAEMIAAVETDGDICRDDSNTAIVGGGSGAVAELRWWANLFIGYVWDGQE